MTAINNPWAKFYFTMTNHHPDEIMHRDRHAMWRTWLTANEWQFAVEDIAFQLMSTGSLTKDEADWILSHISPPDSMCKSCDQTRKRLESYTPGVAYDFFPAT